MPWIRCSLVIGIALILLTALTGERLAQRGVGVKGRGQAPDNEQRVALVIGNSAYTRISKLRNPANDAQDMAAALKASGFQVTLLLNANRGEMGEAIGEFEDALRKGGVGLFFFAGMTVGSTRRFRNFLFA